MVETVPATARVSSVNVALIAPAGTTTTVGATTGSTAIRDTLAPTAGAGAVNVTVPPRLFPPTTVVAFNTIEASAARRPVTVRAADCMLVPLSDAAIVAVPADTPVTVNVALDAPATIATVAGTVATAGLLLDSEMITPAAGAAVVIVTVPCPLAPADTVVAASATADTPVVVVGEVELEPPH